MDESLFKFNIDYKNKYDYVTYQTSLIYKRINNNFKNNYYSLFKHIEIENISEDDYNDLTLHFNFNSDLIKINDISIAYINHQEKVIIDKIDPLIEASKLYKLVEPIELTLNIFLLNVNKEVLYETSIFISLFPFCLPKITSDDYSLFSSFVTPNDYLVNKVVIEASEDLKKINNETSFLAYQNKNINDIRAEMMAIFNCLYRYNIAYSNPPASFSFSQKIRIPQEVLKSHKGTCIDLAILYCACLENIGLHPILIITKDHSYAGAFLDEFNHFNDFVTDNASLIYNMTTGKLNSIELVECTYFTNDNLADYNLATKEAIKETLNNNECFKAIDINRTHRSFYKPIPTFNENEEIDFKIKINGANNNLELIDTENNGKIILKSSSKKDKFSYWEKKLLDLSFKNKLINLKFNSSALQVLNYSSQNFLTYLLSNSSFKVEIKEYTKTSESTLYFSFENIDFQNLINDNYKRNIVSIVSNENNLKKIIKKANATIEETGANPLYLTLGLIRYSYPKTKKYFYAPIILIPLRGKAKKYNGYYDFDYEIDDAFINTTLFEFFKVNFNVNFDELYDVCDNLDKLNLKILFNSIRAKASKELDLIVDENASFISMFSFTNYILWDDIKNRQEELNKNKVINALVEAKNIENIEESEIKIDDNFSPSELAIPLSADSSQIKAIIDATNGKTFVLDGPPGTGKSQTIVNMITNALYHHKTVLFVAEKMAALEVVYKRLKDINLSRFCLELHSNKATKRSVLEQLKEALEFESSEPPIEFKEKSEKLFEKRKKLNNFLSKFHENKNGFTSLYDAILKYENNKEFADILELNPEFVICINKEKDDEIKEELRKLNVLFKNNGKFVFNPYFLYDSTTYNLNLENDLKEILNNLIDVLTKISESFDDLIKEIDLDFYFDREIIDNLYETLDLILNNDVVFNITLGEELLETNETNLTVFKDLEENDVLLNKYLRYFVDNGQNIDFSNFNLEDKSYFNLIKIKKHLKKYLVNKKIFKINKNNLFEIVNAIFRYKNNCIFINLNEEKLLKYFNITKDEIILNYEKYIETYKNSLKLLEITKNLKLNSKLYFDYFTKLNNIKINNFDKFSFVFNNFKKLFNNLKEIEGRLTEKYKFNLKYLKFESSDYFDQYLRFIKEELDEPRKFDDVVLVNKILDELEKTNFSTNFKDLFKLGILDENHLTNYYEVSLYKGIISNYMLDTDFSTFNGLMYNDLIDQYHQLVNEYSRLVILETASRISSNFPNLKVDFAQSSKVYQLNRLIKNGGQKTSIRKMLNELEDLIRTLCPCFLMSPLSAAQYLSVNSKKFDIVIFDEASQIPTYEAIGAISRGNSLIIAGDPEQLPPTNFFKANNVSDNEEYENLSDDYDDLESLLDDCLALNIKRNKLLWHYRSKHESLINFSNNLFYQNKLYTFPSPDNNLSRVSLHYVPYGNNIYGVNKEEAREVLKEVIRRFNNPKQCHKSIGIITFNIKQQEYITDLINDYFDTHPDISLINENNKDQLFVKNLESVQGDERDVILFSIGFSKNKNNQLNLFFGPLSLDKGERRLNVAITRAREEMIVFSSIKASDIDSSKAKNLGADALKSFLAYAEYGNKTLIKNSSNLIKHELGIEKSIQKDLKIKGYDSDIAIGDSKFRIDIGIKGEDGTYKLGIICDGESYYKDNTCRDRNVIQVMMVNSLKRKIYRVWTIEYYRNPKKVINDIIDILKNIDNYKFNDESLNVEKIDVQFKKKKPITIDNGIEYKKYMVAIPYTYNIHYKNSLHYHRELVNYLNDLIKVEGPISLDLIKERFKELIDVKKWGTNVEILFNANFSAVNKIVNYSLTKRFFWPPDTTEFVLKNYRKSPYYIRTLDNIPLEEYIVALDEIMFEQNDIALVDAIKLLASKFSYQKISDVTNEILTKVIKEICDKNASRFKLYVNDLDNEIHIKINYLK